MKQRLLQSITASIEWRLIAFVVTNVFLYLVTGALWESTVLALGLQAVLFAAHLVWYFLRETGHPRAS